MITNSLASIITILATIFLAFLVYTKNRKSHINITFAVFTLGVGVWVFSNFMADIASTDSTLLFWTKSTVLGSSLIPISLLYFCRIFPIRRTPWPLKTWLLLSVPVAIIYILAPTNFNVK